ncbi:MAG TPA: ABC transporter permease [Acidimicrobiales bacterium]|jgi:NitT/TauT family transport system permease protein|nr:ABC transporter permease [Acidimicrobiales bacterium]
MSTSLDVTAGPAEEIGGPRATPEESRRWNIIRRGDPGPDPETRRHKRIVRIIQIAIVLVALGLWEYLGKSSKTLNLTISTPWDTAKWIGQWAEGKQAHGWSDLVVTLEEAAYGMFLGVLIGVVLAVVVSTSKWVRLFSAPFVSMLNALPKIALAPLFILIFGESVSARAYFVAAGIFFITFYNVFGGIRSIDVIYLRNARVLGANRRWLVRDVYAPSIVGWVMTSLRLTSAWALTGAVIAEYLGSVKGMGYIVATGQQSSSTPEVLGGVLIVAVVALIVDRVIVRIERHFSVWRLA